MYIEFQLSNASYWSRNILDHILVELDNWSTKHDAPHRYKIHKQTIRVTFEDDRFYTLFTMSWANDVWADYQLIVDLNNRHS